MNNQHTELLNKLKIEFKSKNWCPCKEEKSREPIVVHGEKGCLPPYIPFIGSQYFEDYPDRPRVMFYAVNQNLPEEATLTKKYSNNPEAALDRLNELWNEKKEIDLQPHTEGYAQILCALVLYHASKDKNINGNINDLSAFTNFVKFSFRNKKNKKMNADPPKRVYEECFKLYVLQELKILQPTHVICMGSDVAYYFAYFEKHEAEFRKLRITLIPVAHSSGRVRKGSYGHIANSINGWYGIREKTVIEELRKHLENFQFNIPPPPPKKYQPQTPSTINDELLINLIEENWFYLGVCEHNIKKHVLAK